ncbi:MAG: hypothetical protein ACJAWL_002705 [Motiliproteus sp.]|jgi:hypothetical protein
MGYLYAKLPGDPVAGLRVRGSVLALTSGGGQSPGQSSGQQEIESCSDAWGRFQFDGLKPGAWTIRVYDGKGREVGRGNVAVFDSALSSVDIDAVLDPPHDPAVDLALYAALDPACDVNNAAQVTLEPTFFDEEYLQSSAPRPSPQAAKDAPITATGSVRGCVVRLDTGEPVAEAALMVVQSAGAAPDIAPLTNASGEFALDGLPPGICRLRATDQDGRYAEEEVSVLAGGVAEVLIAVAGG